MRGPRSLEASVAGDPFPASSRKGRQEKRLGCVQAPSLSQLRSTEMHSLKKYLVGLSALSALWLNFSGLVNIEVSLELGALALILKAIYRR